MAQRALDTNKKFREFVKYKRTKLGLSQKALASKALGQNVHTAISMIETGNVPNITVDTMNSILEALGCDIDFVEK